jgi:hypothetical protein
MATPPPTTPRLLRSHLSPRNLHFHKEGLYGEDDAVGNMYQQSHSVHAFFTQELRTTKKLQLHQVHEDFKTLPCFTHMLDDADKCETLETCSWIDVLCPGQHPRETREFINETRREQGLATLEPEVQIFSELDKSNQIETLEDEMIRLKWRFVPHASILFNSRQQRSTLVHSGGDDDSSNVRRMMKPRRPSPTNKKSRKGQSPQKLHQHVHHSNEQVMQLEAQVESLRAQ